ncbi:hypothetical protein BT69DRAFT_1352591, partial [Atractiella rhizophila]
MPSGLAEAPLLEVHPEVLVISELPKAERERIAKETLNHFYHATIGGFLQEFFPDCANISLEAEVDMSRLKKFRKTMGGKGELKAEKDMYSNIAEFMNCLLERTELEFWNLHRYGDSNDYDGKPDSNKPDFTAVMRGELKPEDDCYRQLDRMCWKHCCLLGHARYRKRDPFVPSRWSRKREDALRRILHYFTDLTYVQQRTSSVLILFFTTGTRAENDQFAKFCCLVRVYASGNQGVDDQFTKIEGNVAEEAVAVFNGKKELVQRAGFSIPNASDWQSSRQLVVGKLAIYRPSVFGRNGKYFVGYEKGKLKRFISSRQTGRTQAGVMTYGGYPKSVNDLHYTLKNSPHATPSTKIELQKVEQWVKEEEAAIMERTYPEQRLHFLVLPF